MKMAGGGFRPAYNVQLATAGSPMGGARTIIGVRVTNVGSDLSSVSPMLDDIERRTGRLPAVLLADANHGDHDSIRDAEARGVTALIAVPQSRGGATWRASVRKTTHRLPHGERACRPTKPSKNVPCESEVFCELPNAHFKSRLGLGHLLVRGLNKVTCVVLLTALASNLLAHVNALLAT